MPKNWYDRREAMKIEERKQRELYLSIVADRKPYFMRYIYPDLMKKYNTYIKKTERKALMEFGKTVDELDKIPIEQLSDEQIEFVRYYRQLMPVGVGGCVMNKICRKIEIEFEGLLRESNKESTFDYRILMSDTEYNPSRYRAIKKLYEEYVAALRSFSTVQSRERTLQDDQTHKLNMINARFKRQCDMACPNEDELCNIIVDLCYKRASTKRFVWTMCGTTLIQNLLRQNNDTIHFPTLDTNGDIKYCGQSFTVNTKQLGEVIY